MSSSLSAAQNTYKAIGVPPPRKTFLDSRPSSGAPKPERPSSGVTQPAPPNAQVGNGDGTKAMLLASHKAELEDMLQESVAQLKNVYRSKFVFGDHLKFVDPSYGGDTVNQFNLTQPPVFDPAFAGSSIPTGSVEMTGGASVPGGQGGADNATTTGIREKLRTAEELIKKLYRRNTQLEVENKYLKGEIQHHEKLSGLSRTGQHNMCFVDGHIPNEHPLYNRRMRRHCRSCPPARTLLRTAVDGYGLKFPPRGAPAGTGDDDAPREDPVPVQQLKKRVLQLTEAVVTVQHENEKLVADKAQRMTLRDQLMKNYILQRDQQIASLHTSLQDVIAKVNNPMRLSRARQPGAGVNPVVATNNVLKEVNARLSDQITSLTDEILRKAGGAIPPSSPVAGGADATMLASPTRTDRAGMMSMDATNATNRHASVPHPPGSRPGTAPTVADATVVGTGPVAVEAASNAAQSLGARRKDLTRRIRGVVDTLPVQKRKQLLLILAELKEIYVALANANHSLLGTFDEYKVQHSQEIVAMRLQVALLRDQLRALGVREDDVDAMAAGTAQNSAIPEDAAATRGAVGGGDGTSIDP